MTVKEKERVREKCVTEHNKLPAENEKNLLAVLWPPKKDSENELNQKNITQ